MYSTTDTRLDNVPKIRLYTLKEEFVVNGDNKIGHTEIITKIVNIEKTKINKKKTFNDLESNNVLCYLKLQINEDHVSLSSYTKSLFWICGLWHSHYLITYTFCYI